MAHYEVDGFEYDIKLSGNKYTVQADFGTSYQGYGKTAKAVFTVNSGDITALSIFDSKGNKHLSFSQFSDPKNALAVVADVLGAFNDSKDQPDYFPEALYPVWNHMFDGDFKVVASGKVNFIDVGTGGKATIVGGKGNDTVVVLHPKDIDFNGGKGTDTLWFDPQNQGETLTLAVGATIDLGAPTNPNPFGSGTITLTSVENLFGSIYDDVFHGTDGKNRLDGGWDGVDKLFGEGGDDTLIFLPSTKIGGADGGEGKDLLWVEDDLGIAGTNILDLTNQANNSGIFAGATVDGIESFRFDEFAGQQTFEFHGTNIGETVRGGFGSDKLFGNGGNDVLIGGKNPNPTVGPKDEMTGGGGKDKFVFEDALDSHSGAALDTIMDFSHAEGDLIDLHGIDANFNKPGNQAFKFIGEKAITGLGQLAIFFDSGSGDVLVSGNIVGSNTPDFVLRVADISTLVKGDFLL